MSHGPNRYRAERRKAETAADRAAANPGASERAQRIIGVWNARARRRRLAEFFPTFDTALAARCWRLTYCCPACQQIATIDIRDFAHAHHPRAPISMLIPKLSCQRCCPDPPLAVLIALESPAAEFPVTSAWPSREPNEPHRPSEPSFEQATMGDLARNDPRWLWLRCENVECRHKRAVAIVPFVIRWGVNAPSEGLRQSMRCTKCGHKGAATYHPPWIDMTLGWQAFPADCDET
jgi:hypothetical protein